MYSVDMAAILSILINFKSLLKPIHNFTTIVCGGGKYNASGKWAPDKGLGMAKVLDFINVKWWNDGDEVKRDEYRVKYKEKEKEYIESFC